MDAAIPDIDAVERDSIHPVFDDSPTRICSFNDVLLPDQRLRTRCPDMEISSKLKVAHSMPEDFGPVTHAREKLPEVEWLHCKDRQSRPSKTSEPIYHGRKTFEVCAQCRSEQRERAGIGF